MGIVVAARSQAPQGSWSLPVHCYCGLEYRAPRRSAVDLGLRGLPRLGQGSFAAGSLRRLGSWLAANSACPGKAPELGFDAFVEQPLETPVLGGGHRLALGTLLRGSRQEPQRNL